LSTSIEHHFAVFRALEEDQKGKGTLVDILIKLMEKNTEKLHCMFFSFQAQYRSPASLLAATAEIVPRIAQEAPHMKLPAAVETRP
jgi:hypothetical protein